MLTKLRQPRAQSALEYSVFIVLIIAAIIAMKDFYTRAHQGRMEENLAKISDQPFEPDNNYQRNWTENSEGSSETWEYAGEIEDLAGGRKTVMKASEIRYTEKDEEMWGSQPELSGFGSE